LDGKYVDGLFICVLESSEPLEFFLFGRKNSAHCFQAHKRPSEEKMCQNMLSSSFPSFSNVRIRDPDHVGEREK